MSFRIPHHVVAKYFAPNLALAHLAPLGTTADVYGIRQARPVKLSESEPFPVMCANEKCKITFHTTNVRKRFCNDVCKNAQNVADHRRRRTLAQNENAKHRKKAAWNAWRLEEQQNYMGLRTPPPPPINGRPTQEEKDDRDEWERLDAIRRSKGLPQI